MVSYGNFTIKLNPNPWSQNFETPDILRGCGILSTHDYIMMKNDHLY